MTKREALTKSAVVALIIGMVFPMGWVVFTSTAYQTPVIEKSILDQMTDVERERWSSQNTAEASFAEHVSSVPVFISNHWSGYLQASFGIFILVFVINGAYLLGGRK
ncbi:MAG TPA: hypothetical protein ENG14_01925 [Thermodesulforhabdus norvegica]|uniref:Uncharacterized protein n=1 Tax=Thermodesulforhabdus norvegica TaxID=39841 RepID=A0A7C0WT62_9BACT|nr:hypothetical protein [Thermodesulforhabdus norvegica]